MNLSDPAQSMYLRKWSEHVILIRVSISLLHFAYVARSNWALLDQTGLCWVAHRFCSLFLLSHFLRFNFRLHRYGIDADGGGGADFGFLGFYIVMPSHRGRGIGIALWHEGMRLLTRCRNIGLDGVVAQQPNYRKSGFVYAYANVRFEGVAGKVCREDDASTDSSNIKGAVRKHASLEADSPVGFKIIALRDVPLDKVCSYDRTVFPTERRAFLEQWTQLPQSTGLACVYDGSHHADGGVGGDLAGFGVIRACRRGHKIGPLYGNTPVIAAALFDALMQAVPAGDTVMIDTPAVNPAAAEMVTQRGLKRGFETARMYTAGEPHVALDRLFGVTTFELG